MPTDVVGILCMLQVITGADFHPSHCNLFAFSSSKGSIRVADMRSSALCDRQARSYEEAQATVSSMHCHAVSGKHHFYEFNLTCASRLQAVIR